MELLERLKKTKREMPKHVFEALPKPVRQMIVASQYKVDAILPTMLYQPPSDYLMGNCMIDVRTITIPEKVEGVDYRVLARDFHQPQMFTGDKLDMRWVPKPYIIYSYPLVVS